MKKIATIKQEQFTVGKNKNIEYKNCSTTKNLKPERLFSLDCVSS